jgi:hypothetical protein
MVSKNIHLRKGNLFNKWCWKNCISILRRMKLDPCLTPVTKINSKEITDLNERHETVRRQHRENTLAHVLKRFSLMEADSLSSNSKTLLRHWSHT